MLTESLVLSVIGGGLGMLIAVQGVAYARGMPENRLPRAEEMAIDHRVLAIATLASILTAIVCGLWPALRASSASTAETLRAGSLASVGNRSDSRLRRVLVTAQFALALMLLAGAGLLVQSFRRAAAVDIGFDASQLMSVRLDPPAAAYPTAQDAAALYERLIAATSAVPGVASSAFINHMPFGRAGILTPVEVESRSASDTSFRQVFYRTVSSSYLRTMHMSLAGGRWFDESDMRSPGGGFIVNETMAKRYWPGETAVGKRLTIHRSSQARPDFGQPLPGVVIGVIHDVHQFSQDALPAPEVYVPYTLEAWPWGSIVVRASDSPATRSALRDAIASVDPRLIEKGTQGAERFARIDNAVTASLEPRKLSVTLIGAFATCALVLAAIGMYGVVSYGITQRTRELGVRKALGATNGMIASLVLRESLTLTGAGIVIGCAGAFAGAKLIRSLLFQSGAADPVAYLTTIAVLVSTAIVATLVPARRATRLDPTVAMRGE
jgi:putative ABC transport system permease protein